MLTLFAFLGLISVLVTIHEFGHYWVARRCGVKVLRFALGFGKPIWLRRFGQDQTEFAICILPLGGYVRMLDEREAPVEPNEVHRAFNRRPVWMRMLVVLAGPFANFLLAILIYSGMLLVGMADFQPRLGSVLPSTPAAQAGFQGGDRILTMNGTDILSWEDFRLRLFGAALGDERVELEVLTTGGTHATRVLDFSARQEKIDVALVDRLGLIPEFRSTVVGKEPKGAALKAGLKEGDRILSIDGLPVADGGVLIDRIQHAAGQLITLEVRRQGQVLTLQATPDTVQENGQRIGKLGVSLGWDAEATRKQAMVLQLGPWQALQHAMVRTRITASLSLQMLGKMLTGRVGVENLGGPGSVAKVSGEAAAIGWVPYLLTIAFVSIGLGVLNLLPVPMLDGGHFMYYVAELIKGSPVSVRAQEIGQYVGVAVLLMLMSIALYNDVQRLFLHA